MPLENNLNQSNYTRTVFPRLYILREWQHFKITDTLLCGAKTLWDVINSEFKFGKISAWYISENMDYQIVMFLLKTPKKG